MAYVYAQYMQSTGWLRRRERYYLSHARRCAVCRTAETVELHHLSYEHVYAEPDEDLMPLCQFCHSLVHQIHQRSEDSLAVATHKAVGALTRSRVKRPKQRPKPVGGRDPNAILFAQIRERGQGFTPIPQKDARRRGIAALKWQREHGMHVD